MSDDENQPKRRSRWPRYLFRRVRTSTVVLIVVFLALFWLYQVYEPPKKQPEQVPASQVVPPGFVPDPDYTWVPRTNVQTPKTTAPATTTTPTTTTTTETTAPTSPTTSGSPTTTPTSTTPAPPGAPPPTPATPSPSPTTTPSPTPSR
ncbi:MAG TPA: hypothetical protein VH496_19625 [Mycobacterium sp.]